MKYKNKATDKLTFYAQQLPTNTHARRNDSAKQNPNTNKLAEPQPGRTDIKTSQLSLSSSKLEQKQPG